MSRRAVHVPIGGHVQGGGYRAFAQRTALSLGLEGWVRNRRGGQVEAFFTGDETQIALMLAALRQGPPASRVTDVDVQEAEAETLNGFAVRPTV